MRAILPVFLMVSVSFFGQIPEMKAFFSDEEISIANTGATATYLTPEEKNVVTWINLARTCPNLFQEVIIYYSTEKYGTAYKNNSYVKSLLTTLKKMKPIAALIPDIELYDFAFCWAKEAGAKGYIGHNRKKCKYGFMAECCAYNNRNDGFYQVCQLLIDEGVRDLGHRKTMLSSKYTSIGVSIQPHKKYGSNAVLDFN